MAGGSMVAQKSGVKHGAWWALACCASLSLIAGTIYGFSAWSPVFKETYGFHQKTIDRMAVISHLGNYVVLDSGILIARFGTAFGMGLGCLYASLGYLFLWACVELWPGQISTVWIFAGCALFGHGCGTLDTAVMTEVLADFRDYRGFANGCIKAYFALATATVAMIYEAVFKPQQSAFLLFLGVYAAAAALTFVPVVFFTGGLVEGSEKKVKQKFTTLGFGIVVFALYFLIVQVNKTSITPMWWKVILMTVVLGMLGFFLLPLSRDRSSSQDVEKGEVAAKVVPVSSPLPRNLSGKQIFLCVDFWIFWFVFVIAQGSGLMFLSNASQILPALAGHSMKDSTTAFIAGVSVFNSLARLICGVLSELLRGKVPRTIFLVFAVALLSAGYAGMWLLGNAVVWPCALLIGFGYGALWGVQSPIVCELFGPSDFSFKYSCSHLAAAIGSILFNELLAGPVFDRNAEHRPEYPQCYDSSCFDGSLSVAAIAGVPAILLALLLVQRTRWIYDELEAREVISDASTVSAQDPDSRPEASGCSC